jgi:hypothetical protein
MILSMPIPSLSILASFLDPGDNGWDIGDAAQQLLFAGAMCGTLWAAFKFFLLPAVHTIVRQELDAVRIEMKEQLEKATKPIQKEANGGYSLPDVARKSDWNGEALKAIATHMGVELPEDETLKRNIPHAKEN